MLPRVELELNSARNSCSSSRVQLGSEFDGNSDLFRKMVQQVVKLLQALFNIFVPIKLSALWHSGFDHISFFNELT